jgi:adenylate cyclase
MRATRLIRLDVSDAEQSIVLADVTTVGRQPTNTVQIIDRLVSGEHAVIQRVPGSATWQLKDLNSRNGTFINNVKVEEVVTLRDGDVLRFGTTEWKFAAEVARTVSAETLPESGNRRSEIMPAVQATMQVPFAQQFMPSDMVDNDRMLRADYEKLRLAYTLSLDLHEAKDIDTLLDRLLQRIFEWLPVDRAAVLFLDESRTDHPADRLLAAAVKTRPGARFSDGTGTLVPRSILHQAMTMNAAILSMDARLDERFKNAESVKIQGIRSSMTVPLMTNDRLIGALHVDSLISSGLFTEKDLAVLAAVARQASVSIDNALLQRRLLEEAALRLSLSRMLSPNLVERIVSGDLVIEKSGAAKRVTVLFADIRGFTSLTERLPPVEMVAMMNDYFERLSNIVFQHQGTLDKYIGDAVMALWGAPLGTDDDELRAVQAGHEMQMAVRELNFERAKHGKEQICVGIGIATAQVIAGYVGSTRTMSYTVFGRGVNLAARLCSMATAGEVLVSPSTYEAVKDYVKADELPETFLKGMADPVRPVRVSLLQEPVWKTITSPNGNTPTPDAPVVAVPTASALPIPRTGRYAVTAGPRAATAS